MVKSTNREIEAHYFEQFRAHYQLPPAEVLYGDAPDVRLIGNTCIGVEIARLYVRDGGDPGSEQVQANKRDKVLSLAQEIYLERGGRSIELFVDFDPLKPISSVEVSADRLASLAKEIESFPARLAGDLPGNAD